MVILLLFTQDMNALVSSNTNLGKNCLKTTQLLRDKMTTQLLIKLFCISLKYFDPELLSLNSRPSLVTFMQVQIVQVEKSQTMYGLTVPKIRTTDRTKQTQSKSNINVQWKRIGQPISDQHFHYLSHQRCTSVMYLDSGVDLDVDSDNLLTLA